MRIVHQNIGCLGVKMNDNEYTITELADYINISAGQLRLYTSHYSLSKFVIRTYKKKTHPSLGINLTEEFITNFLNYLTIIKKRSFKEERRKFIKKQLERLLYA